MDSVFALLLLLALICLFLGLVRPSLFTKWFNRVPTRRTIAAVFGTATFVLMLAIGITASPSATNTHSVVSKQQDVNQLSDISTQDSMEPLAVADDQEVATEELIEQPDVEGSAHTQQPTPAPRPQAEESGGSTDDNETSVGYLVVSVVDGDTIKVDIDGTVTTVRLLGVDTPETVHPSQPVECFGQEASSRAKELLEGTQVRLEIDATQGNEDRYGRLLRYVFLSDGTHVNKQLISEGYAYEYTYSTPYQYQVEFKQVQAEAQSSKQGLWADGVCEEAPDSIDTETEESTDEEPAPPVTPEEPQASGYKFYTSSHYSTKYYYCETDPGWERLSTKNLQVYDSEVALLADHPDHVLHAACE